MLVVTRKERERIFALVGDIEIVIEVCRINAADVKLGFTAPREVVVLREELRDRRPAGGR